MPEGSASRLSRVATRCGVMALPPIAGAIIDLFGGTGAGLAETGVLVGFLEVTLVPMFIGTFRSYERPVSEMAMRKSRRPWQRITRDGDIHAFGWSLGGYGAKLRGVPADRDPFAVTRVVGGGELRKLQIVHVPIDHGKALVYEAPISTRRSRLRCKQVDVVGTFRTINRAAVDPTLRDAVLQPFRKPAPAPPSFGLVAG
jgi:hypothetical protein